jgi:F-box protein 21
LNFSAHALADPSLPISFISNTEILLEYAQVLEMTVKHIWDTPGEEGSITLGRLPDEVLQHILSFCSPQDILVNIQRTSKRLSRLGSEPLLWRHHCRVEFKYWDSKHRIVQKLAGRVGDVDWKKLYTHRQKIDKDTSGLLDSILAEQVDRISKFKSISEFGYDAKDTLLRHCRTEDAADDVLARR